MKMWIARDRDKALALFRYRPIKNRRFFNVYDKAGCGRIPIDREQFPEVTFENSPMEVELVIKSQNKVTECYNCHEVINFTEDDVIEDWYVKCPCCGEEISILP